MSTANLSDITLRDAPEAIADAIIADRGTGKPQPKKRSQDEFILLAMQLEPAMRPRLAEWLQAFYAEEKRNPDGRFEREFLIEQVKTMQVIVADNHRLQTARN